MGQPLSENNFYAIILGSLPASFDPYILAVNTTSSVLGKTISADDLMLTVTEEYECQNLKNKTGKKDENAAFYSNDSGKEQKRGSSLKKNVECHNCHKKGHYSRDCWAPGGGTEGQGPNQKGKKKAKEDEKKDDKKKETGGAAAAETKGKEKDTEEAWLVVVNSMSEEEEYECGLDKDIPGGIIDLDDSIIDYPDFNELEELTRNLIPHPITPFDTNSNPNEGAFTSMFSADELAGSAETCNMEVDLYDSGASRHMSGFHHKFINIVAINPISIMATDKHTFKATGKGKMIIHLPNGDDGPSRIQLMDALNAPSMGVTLVSISCVEKAGCCQGNLQSKRRQTLKECRQSKKTR